MDPKVTKQLIKTSKSLRDKFKSIKSDLQLSQVELEKSLKPITEPLQELVQQKRKQSVEEKPSTPVSFTEPLQELVQQRKQPLKEKPSTSVSSKVPRRAFKREGEVVYEEEEEEEEDEITPLKKIHQFDKDELQQSMEAEERIGPLWHPYLLKIMQADTKDMDERYGIRVLPTGGMVIGNVEVIVEGDNINIDDNWYEGTPGLLQLLFLKKPTEYTEEDLEKYKNILEISSAHRRQFSEEKIISSSRGWKYKNIIAPLFSTTEKSLPRVRYNPEIFSTRASTPLTHIATKPSKDLRYPIRSKHTSGTGMREGQSIYEYWDNPNQLVDRLRLLIASTSAGHSGHENEITSIMEELREAGVIY